VIFHLAVITAMLATSAVAVYGVHIGQDDAFSDMPVHGPHVVTLWKFQSLDEVETLVYMEVYILSRLLNLEESFILNIVEN